MADAYGITVSDAWLAAYARVLAEAGFRLVHHIGFGDSLLEGYNTTDRWDLSAYGLTRDHMQAKHGDGGSGFLSMVEVPSASAAPPDQVTEVGTWQPFIGGLGTQVVGTNGEGLIFPRVRGERVSIWWQPGTGLSPVLGVVDGEESRATVQTPSLPPVAALMRLGADSPRDVLLFVEAGGGAILTGVEGLNQSGVVFHNVSHFGVTSAYVSSPGYSGAVDPHTVGKFILLYNFHRPDVFDYALMVNDWGLGVPAATFETNMRLAFTLARQRNPKCLLVATINHPGTGALGTWEQYRTRAYTVAGDYDAAVVDYWARSGLSQAAPYTTGAGNYFSDAVHVSNLGAAWQAESKIRLYDRAPAALLAA